MVLCLEFWHLTVMISRKYPNRLTNKVFIDTTFICCQQSRALNPKHWENRRIKCLVEILCESWKLNEMIGVIGHDSALRLYWAGDKLGEYDEFCYESYPWRRIDRSTCWPAVLRTIEPRMPPVWIMKWIRSGESLKRIPFRLHVHNYVTFFHIFCTQLLVNH